jgi:hypothetical protein
MTETVGLAQPPDIARIAIERTIGIASRTTRLTFHPASHAIVSEAGPFGLSITTAAE